MFEKTLLVVAIVVAFASATFAAPDAQAQEHLHRVEITDLAIERISGGTALPVTVIRVDDPKQQGVTLVE